MFAVALGGPCQFALANDTAAVSKIPFPTELAIEALITWPEEFVDTRTEPLP